MSLEEGALKARLIIRATRCGSDRLAHFTPAAQGFRLESDGRDSVHRWFRTACPCRLLVGYAPPPPTGHQGARSNRERCTLRISKTLIFFVTGVTETETNSSDVKSVTFYLLFFWYKKCQTIWPWPVCSSGKIKQILNCIFFYKRMQQTLILSRHILSLIN